MSCRRVRRSSAVVEPSAASPPAGARATALRWKPRPSTAARSTTARSDGGRRVDARGEQRLDRRGRPAALRRLVAHRDDLLEEERVALGRREHALGVGRPAMPVPAASSASSSGGVVVGQRAERDDGPCCGPAAPVRPALEQLGPGEADQQQRDAAGDGRRRARAGRAASARPSGCRRRTTTSGRSRGARSRAARRTAQCASSTATGPGATPTTRAIALRRSRRASSSSPASRGDRRLVDAAGEPADDLGQRPVRDALAVRQAAARRRPPRAAQIVVEQLAHEPRLADAGDAGDGHRRGRARCATTLVERVAQRAELVARGRRARAPARPRRPGRRSTEPPGLDRRPSCP